MLQSVLKAFPYAHDGITVVELDVGDVTDIRKDLVEGLTKAGYVGEPEPGAVAKSAKADAEAALAAAPAEDVKPAKAPRAGKPGKAAPASDPAPAAEQA